MLTCIVFYRGYSPQSGLDYAHRPTNFDRYSAADIGQNCRSGFLISMAAAESFPAEGASFRVVGGPICADGLVGWWVENQGVRGWTAEGEGETYWLEP
jgi:hypothetical protein